jgi:rSAM/selenodomain-associated transferase 1
MGGEHFPFCGIAVMAKASIPGRTKTRLSPPLTLADAAEFNTAFLKDIAENLLRAAEKASIAGYIAYGPPGAEGFFREHIPPQIRLMEVWYPNLGDCLIATLNAQFAAGHRAACVLNSDSPTLPSEFLVETASILAAPGDRIVLGPSTDGGYYLLACKTLHRRLFEEITWSSEVVCAQTLERAAEIGVPVHMLPEWYDVDDCAALKMLAGEVLGGVAFHPTLRSSPARHSTALMARLLERPGFADAMNGLAPLSARASEAVT